MELSRQGAGFILSHEGIFLEAYPDPATNGEPWTIGGGHTAAAGGLRPVPGMFISLEKALHLFITDMEKYGKRVEQAITRGLMQHVFEGFSSFDLNTGAIFKGSIDDKWNRGDAAAAMATLLLYKNAAGKVMPGLVRRRKEEAELITKGVYPGHKILVKDSRKSQGRYVTVDELPWKATPVAVTFTPRTVPPLPERKPEQPLNVFHQLLRKTWKMLKWMDEKLSQ
jgi:lysozyme